MNWNRIALRAVLIVAIVGILVAAGVAIYRVGYAQGASDALADEGFSRFGLRGIPDFRGPRSMVHSFGFRAVGPMSLFGFGWPLLSLGLFLLLAIGAGVLIGSRMRNSRSARADHEAAQPEMGAD